MDLPATQIFYDYEDEPTQKIVPNAVKENEQVGILIVNSNSYPIYTGINKIGRHPECEIFLNDQSVSKYHAEIEANKHTSCTWICDLKSSNRTKLNNVTLRPSRFYELQDNSVLEFGRIKAIYKNHKPKKDFVIPETPVQSKQKNPTTVIPGTPDSLLSNSSVFGEDISMIAATQSGLRKSDSSHSTTDQLLPKVLKDNDKNSARTLSLDSNSECKRTESHNKDDKTQDNEVLEDGPSRFSVETMQNNSTREQNDPSTSCESDDIFEAVTQRVNIDLNFRNRRESCSSDETNIDEDAIINDMAPTQITHNTLESSTPIKKTNLEDQLDKLKNIKCDQVNTNTIDDIDLLDTQVVSLPDSICTTKEIKTFEKQDVINHIDTLDTQIVNLPDSDYGVNNEQQKEKRNDIDDIHLVDTQSVSIINKVDKNISSSVVKEGQQNSINNGSIEDVNYETASTQLIEDVEALSKEENSKTTNSGDKKLRKSNGNDSLERKLNDMFEEVNDDHVAEMSMISTQSLRNVLECSQRSSRAVDTTSHSVNDALSAQVQDVKSVDSNSQMPEMDSQNTEKYFSSFISKRKHNVLTDSQESIDSNITISARRKKKKESNIKTLETDKNDSTLIKTSSEKSIKRNQNTTHSEKTVDHVEKDLLNSFEVSVHSSKEDAKCAETSKSLDEEDDEDILTRLPEVNISGTFSNPTTTLSTSRIQKKKSAGSSRSKRTNKKTDVSEVHESTSATTSISDSMEDIDYENLKKIAESLIPRKNNEMQSTKKKTNTKKKINSDSDVSTQNNTKTLSNKPAPNTRGRKSKTNTTMESKSILSFVTRKSTRGNTESMNEINSNTIPTNSNKRQTRKQQINTTASKTNSTNMKDSTSTNICNSPVGKESQEVEMIMNKSLATISQNTRKRKKLNASSDNDSLHDSNISHVNLINSIQYKIPTVRVKRTKFNKNASLQSSIESTSTEDSLTGDSDTSIATNTTKSHSTRSKRTNVKEQKNENNTSILSKMSTRNTLNITKVNMESSEKTAPVSPVLAIRRSVSRLSTSLNSSFSVKEKILFTGITDDEYIKVIKTLGGTKVEDPSKCTVLVTDKIRRTTKFLSALARAVPIVSINWLQESKRAGHFLDWENYMLKDPAMEAKYGFRLRKSLDKAREKKLLEGYTVLLTPNIQSPPTSELKVMIMSCGGKALLRSPPKLSEKTIIISHQDDLENARKLLLKVPKNVTIQSTEFLLTGILKQELDFVRHKLI